MSKASITKYHWNLIKDSADKAPSLFNAKPWSIKFHSSSSLITVEPVVKVFQNDNKSIGHYISIGACIKNIEKTLEVLGFKYKTTIKNTTKPSISIQIDSNISRARSDDHAKLTSIIDARHTVRKPYINVDIDTLVKCVSKITSKNENANATVISKQNQLEFIFKSHIQSMYATNLKKNREIAGFLNINPLKSSTQGFNKDDIGANIITMMLAKLFLLCNSGVLKPKIKEEKMLINSTPAFIIFSSHDYTTDTLIKCGMEIEDLWLKISSYEYVCQPLFSIIANSESRNQLSRELNIANPIFIMRVGRVG